MEEKKKSGFKEFMSYVIIILIIIIIKKYVVSPIRVNGRSMNSTLQDKDIMILDEISYRVSDINRFDIVVIKYQDEYLIKRVIGLPGEKVKYQDDKLYINGVEVLDDHSDVITNDFEYEVPEGEYFVLGDNRVNSTDSRMLGSFKKDKILGKTSLTVFPFSRFGFKD